MLLKSKYFTKYIQISNIPTKLIVIKHEEQDIQMIKNFSAKIDYLAKLNYGKAFCILDEKFTSGFFMEVYLNPLHVIVEWGYSNRILIFVGKEFLLKSRIEIANYLENPEIKKVYNSYLKKSIESEFNRRYNSFTFLEKKEKDFSLLKPNSVNKIKP